MEPDFKKSKLIPAIIQEYNTKKVLMLAYVNKESYEYMLKNNQTCFYSRSRNTLWIKGETSGNTQKIKEMYLDCDRDALLIFVDQKGVACHTGEYSCFFNNIIENTDKTEQDNKEKNINKINENSQKNEQKIIKNIQIINEISQKNINKNNENNSEKNIINNNILEDLFNMIEDRKINKKEKSYTNYLLDEGIDKICKKIGEEATETVIAAKNEGTENFKNDLIGEICDLIYHMEVLMVDRGVTTSDIKKKLTERHKIEGNKKDFKIRSDY